MPVRRPRYSKAEFTRRGNQIYDSSIRSLVESDHIGKFVAIDIESERWEMDTEALGACERLIAQVPDCQTWLVRVGSPALHRMGGPRRPFATT